jgi:hypothetical protein
MTTTIYARPIDNGAGTQTVIVNDTVIAAQWLRARTGRYTGNGNPELIGQPVRVLRGMGFTKLRGAAERDALMAYHETLMSKV